MNGRLPTFVLWCITQSDFHSCDMIRFDLFIDADLPLAGERKKGDGSWTFRQNFSGWWSASLFVSFCSTIQLIPVLYRCFQGRPVEEGHDMVA